MNDDLVERLLWHVEQVLGPVSDEPIVNEHDSDKAVLLFNFQAETKRAIDYWYRQGRDDQYATHADRIEALHEKLAAAYIALSGTDIHASDCATSNAPACEPGPCDCKETAETFTRSDNV